MMSLKSMVTDDASFTDSHREPYVYSIHTVLVKIIGGAISG